MREPPAPLPSSQAQVHVLVVHAVAVVEPADVVQEVGAVQRGTAGDRVHLTPAQARAIGLTEVAVPTCPVRPEDDTGAVDHRRIAVREPQRGLDPAETAIGRERASTSGASQPGSTTTSSFRSATGSQPAATSRNRPRSAAAP